MSIDVIDFADQPSHIAKRNLRELIDRLVAGDSDHVSHIYFESSYGGLISGAWTNTPGKWKAFIDRDEFCSILSGHCRLISEDGVIKEFDVLGPMGHELIPLLSKEDADELLTDHKGSRVIHFDQVKTELLLKLDEGKFE